MGAWNDTEADDSDSMARKQKKMKSDLQLVAEVGSDQDWGRR